MEQPKGYAVAGKGNHVCLLEKILYGLKQALRVWNEKFNLFLTEFGLLKCESNPCVHYRRRGDSSLLSL
jgi:hypothetical protein